MANKKIKISIVTPEQKVFEGEADYIGIPSVGGSLGILVDHLPVICFLDIGIVKIINEKEVNQIAVCRGYLQFVRNNANIITESAIITNDENKAEAINELRKKHNISQEITEETKKIAQATAALKTLVKF
ncbi:MAG: ATP synthase F1 subunit epsilon [Actinobacteria bacterium]|nr:ATP synthase F1 subunit epsilon [Cyanobacteriota bacterium]MCL5771294.1 ATP synthase F1 subunit epsilon [Actinomycetota bacterium]